MAKPRKQGNSNTTISVSWIDKNKLRQLARKVKTTKNGDVYESDSQIFHRVISGIVDNTSTDNTPRPTYPSSSVSSTKDQSSPSDDQQHLDPSSPISENN